MRSKSPILLIAILTGLNYWPSLAHSKPSNSDFKPIENIVGGSEAPRRKWAVKVYIPTISYFIWFINDSCSGTAIRDDYVLTARHCVVAKLNIKNPSDEWADHNVYVQYSNDNKNHANGGERYYADAIYLAPGADIALIHLIKKHPIGEYPKIDMNYVPKNRDFGIIYGYGKHGLSRVKDDQALYWAAVGVIVDGTNYYDLYYGKGIYVGHPNSLGDKTLPGATDQGDSGGPLFVNDKIVGVASHGNFRGNMSFFSNLSQAKHWMLDILGK